MYGIIGEDTSDVLTLKVIVQRLEGNRKLPVRVLGYNGCGELLKKGAVQLKTFRSLGCSKLIICHDSDGNPESRIHEEIMRRIIKPAGCPSKEYAVVIPVQELESWILADIKAVTQIFSSWKPEEVHSPELIPSPKEHLERLSVLSKKRPRYSHATHNPRVAEYLDLSVVERKCPSFHELKKFVSKKVM